MFTKVEAYQDLIGGIHKTREEAGVHSLASLLLGTGEDNAYLDLNGANFLVKGLTKHPQVLDWLVEQVKGKQESTMTHPDYGTRCPDCECKKTISGQCMCGDLG